MNGKVEKDKKFWIKWLEQYFTRLMKDISGMSQDKIAEVHVHVHTCMWDIYVI